MRHLEDDGGTTAKEKEVVGGVHESPSAAVVGTTPAVGEVKADGASAEWRRGAQTPRTALARPTRLHHSRQDEAAVSVG